MDKKSIVVGIDGDTTEITKKLSELKKQAEGMMGAQATLGYSPRDMQMKQAFQRSEGIYRDQMKKKYEEQGKIIDDLLKKERELGKELDRKVESQEELNKKAQEYLQITKELNQAISNQQTAAKNMCPPGSRYNPQTDSCEPITPGGGGGGGNPPTPPGKIGAFLEGAQGTAAGVVAISKAIVDGMDFFNRRRPTYSAERTISLAESMYAPQKRGMKGEAFGDLMFAEERAAARKDSFNMMAHQIDINRQKAGVQGVSGLAGIGVGIGTLLSGGTLPVMLAGLAAIAGGGGLLFGGKGTGFEGLKGLAGFGYEEIDKMTGQETMEYYKTQIAKQKKENPIRSMFKEFLEENREQIINSTRRTGMSEYDFMNNYMLGKGTFGEEEFITKQRLQMTQQMMQSGGSTQAAYGQNMVTALQAQRGLGLGNAGQVMGRLSSYLNPQESEEAFIRILGKGVNIGTAELRDVQQDYFEQVTAIAQQIGTNEDLVASIMSASLQGNMTRRGVGFAAEGTKTALDLMNQKEGLAGALKMKGIMESDTFKNLPAMYTQLLGETRIEDLKKGNPIFEAFYTMMKTDKSRESVQEELEKIFQGSTYGGNLEFTEEIDKLKKMKETGDFTGIYKGQSKETIDALLGKVFGFATNTGGLSQQETATAKGVLNYREMTGKGLQDQISELGNLEANEKFLDENQKKRLEELRKTTAGFRKTPSGPTEQLLSMAGILQQSDISAETVGKRGKGKNIIDIMQELTENMGKNFDKTVAERVQMTNFNEALVNGANEAMKIFASAISDWEWVDEPIYSPQGARQIGTRKVLRKKQQTKSNVKAGKQE